MDLNDQLLFLFLPIKYSFKQLHTCTKHTERSPYCLLSSSIFLLPHQFLLLPTNLLLTFIIFILFCDPLILTRTFCVAMSLELFFGTWWAQQWVQLHLSQSLSTANSSKVKEREGLVNDPHPSLNYCRQSRSCMGPVLETKHCELVIIAALLNLENGIS